MTNTDLSELTDQELVESLASHIYSDACLQSRGISLPRAEALTAAAAEAQRRTPNWHLYTRAYNLATTGIATPSKVPADPRVLAGADS